MCLNDFNTESLNFMKTPTFKEALIGDPIANNFNQPSNLLLRVLARNFLKKKKKSNRKSDEIHNWAYPALLVTYFPKETSSILFAN